MTAVELRHLRAGYCLAPGRMMDRSLPWRIRRVPAVATLITHPTAGHLLFDAGYSRDARSVFRRWPALPYGLLLPVRVPRGDAVADRLAAESIAVSTIILSHHHPDHVGGAVDLPGARLLMDADDIAVVARLRGIRAVAQGLVPALTPSASRLEPLSYSPAPPGLEPFEVAADVLGDQSVLVVRVPGHTAGMVAALVRTRPDAPWDGNGEGLAVLAADVAWTEHALLGGGGPHPFLRLVAHDAAGADASAARLRQWLAAHPRAGLVLSHDHA